MAIEHNTERGRSADLARWPRSTSDLTRTDICPACQSLLKSTICSVCGLDLSHPASVDLMTESLRAADALGRRLALITRMRAESSALAPRSSAGTATADVPASVSAAFDAAVPPAVVPPVIAAPRASAEHIPVTTQPAADAPPRSTRSRVSSVQVALLIAGVSLLSAGAVAFLVYAFINFGIVWRSVIIGGVTIAAFVAATILLRRGLRATAEGIAVFAVVLIYLDAWAVRTNDFFGAAASDPALFWAVTIGVSSAGFVFWSRSTLTVAGAAGDTAATPAVRWLRAPHLVGWFALPGGATLLAVGLTPSTAAENTPYLALASVVLVGLLHPLAPVRRAGELVSTCHPERIALLGAAAVAIVPAIFASFTVGQPDGGAVSFDGRFDPIIPIAALAIGLTLAGLHLVVIRRSAATPGRRLWAGVFGTVPAFVLVGGSVIALLAEVEFVPAVAALMVVAVAVALGVEAVGSGAKSGSSSGGSTASIDRWMRGVVAVSCAVVAAFAALVPLTLAVERLATSLSTALMASLLGGAGMTLAPTTRDSALAMASLALVSFMTVAVWTVRGRTAGGLSMRRSAVVSWALAVVAVLSIPLLSVAEFIASGWLLLGVAAIITLVATHRAAQGGAAALAPHHRGVLGAIAATCLALAWFVGSATVATWIVATVIVIASTVLARATTSDAIARAILLAVATSILMIGSATIPRVASIAQAGIDTSDALDATRVVAVIATLLVAASALAREGRALSDLDRRVMLWIALVVASGSWVILRMSADGAPASELAMSLSALISLLLWQISPSTRHLRVERRVTSVLLGPAVYITIDSFVSLIGLAPTAGAVTAVTAALVTAIGSMIVEVLRPESRSRMYREVGILLVGAPAVFDAILRADSLLWLVLALAALAALSSAIGRDGLVSSVSPRRHIGWAALVLGTASLWVRLGDTGVDQVEAFVLPVTGVLLLVAAGLSRSMPVVPTEADAQADADAATDSVAQRARPSSAVAAITLVGLLVTVLPAALAGIDGNPTRALIVAGLSAALLLIGSFAGDAEKIARRALLDTMTVAGAVGVLVTGVGRAAWLSLDGDPGLEFDGWLAFVLVVLITAGFGIAREPHTSALPGQPAHPGPTEVRDPRLLVSSALAVTALSAIAILEAGAILADTTSFAGSGSPLRAELALLTLCAVHVLAWFISTPPFTRTVAWTAVGLAAGIAAVGVVSGAFDPIEVATVPLALTLLDTGAKEMLDDSAARSWRWLGAGTALLLVPSLIATLDDRPIWRLVSLGVVGVAVLVTALLRRLQAPFVISAAVVTIHALATFSPQIRAVYESVEWWIWLIPGGILVIVLAARLEKRIANLKDLVRSISQLR